MFARICTRLTTLFAAVGSVLVLTAAAQAQVVRYVATFGNDAGSNCTRTAPCPNLQKGINKTPAGGELQILDSGTFGTKATISRPITISAVGVAATVGSITIDAPGAAVVLRGLLLNGTGGPPATSGLTIDNAAVVHVAGCQIERFPALGVAIDADNAEEFVSDTIVRLNGSTGLFVSSNSSGARLTIDNSRFENNNGTGILIFGSAAVTIARAVASANAVHGISNAAGRVNVTATTVANNGDERFSVNTSAAAEMTIESSVSRGNAVTGLFVSFGVGRVSNSVFTNNHVGLEHISGTLKSLGNNMVDGNTAAQTSGTVTTLNPI
jgi:hypothetical protein